MRRISRSIVAAAIALSFFVLSASETSFGSPANKKGQSKRGSVKKPKRSAAKKARAGSRVPKRSKGKRTVARRGRNNRSRRSSRRRLARDVSPAARPIASGIPTERVTEIQEALIKLGYLEGPASGNYDDQTVAAMKEFQAANKLERSGLPSAHSLRKLGVAKRTNDGYAIPVNRLSELDFKRPKPNPM